MGAVKYLISAHFPIKKVKSISIKVGGSKSKSVSKKYYSQQGWWDPHGR